MASIQLSPSRQALLLLLPLLGLCLSSVPATTLQSLNLDWTFQVLDAPSEGKDLLGRQYHTEIPSTLHLDLFKHEKIPDPFFGTNHESIRWVQSCRVRYSKKFQVEEGQLGRASELVLHGVDTYAKVAVNGHELLATNNALRKYEVRVEKYLQSGENLLQITIEPTSVYDQQGQKVNLMPFKYAHTRKACYQYSWDWAPEMNTMGIWRDVQLRHYNEVRIDYVWARNRVIAQKRATINFALKLLFNLFRDDPLSDGYTVAVRLGDQKLKEVPVTETTVYLDVEIQDPKFWWPNGFGSPNMYDFEVHLNYHGESIESRRVPYGIRTAQLDLSNKQFTVKLNGYPVYCKGANYVPLDMLHPRIYNKYFQDEYTYTPEQLLDDAVASNFNMIRLWGGGQYEADEFYEMASRRGIMIFHDFMFSDSIYPSTKDFLVNVEEEVKQQVRRIRNYPALVLWSGNNEILQGVNDWGWNSKKYRDDYHRLFEQLIAKVVKIETPDIAYIPSSPIYGVGNYGFDRGGDFHYWSVWAGGSDFQSYEQAVGPFNSEFGTQALPVWHTIAQFTKPEDRNYNSPVLLSHEKHNSRFGTLQSYMSRYAPKSKDFYHETYLSSVVQAYAIEIAIKAQRAAKPKSYGTLYWQFNDAWPGISWSAIDYYGRWKALQYMAKRTYTNIALFVMSNRTCVAINDNLYEVEVKAVVYVYDFEGKQLSKVEKNVSLKADSVVVVPETKVEQFADRAQDTVVYTQIYYRQQLQMTSTAFFEVYRKLKLPKGTLSVKYDLDNDKITLSADKFIKNLFIDHSDKYVAFSDNYFDLLPHHDVTVQVLRGLKLADIKQGLKYTSVREAGVDQQLAVHTQ